MKNWFNAIPHPTDQYIHWADRTPHKTAIQLRVAWDMLTPTEGNEEYLKRLLSAAYQAGADDVNDSNAGESI